MTTLTVLKRMESKPLRVNFRDVGDNIKGLNKGRLYRSSESFTPPENVRAIIDLRRRGAKLESWHAKSSARFVRHHIPMVGSKGGLSLLSSLPTTTLVQFLLSGGSEAVVGSYYFASPDNIIDMYVRIAENASKELTKIATVLTEDDDGGVVVFCVAGKDRTGIVVSLFARLAGASIEDIAADYCMSQANIRKAQENNELMLANPLLLDSALTQSPWESMVAFLRTIETRYGSVRGFFERKLMFKPALIDAIIAKLQIPSKNISRT
jgi:hypothetical protein